MVDNPIRSEPATLTQELGARVRLKIIDQIAAWAVAGAVVLLSLTITGWGLYLKDKIPQWVGGVPVGSVVAFRRVAGETACPDETWRPFYEGRGRTIVGAGSLDRVPENMKNGLANVAYEANQFGGARSLLLTSSQIPPMKITIKGVYDGSGTIGHGAFTGDQPNGPKSWPFFDIEKAVGNTSGPLEPLVLSPPFVALEFCIKR